MLSKSGRIANFIIGGTERSGTTSVFMYLRDHPQVCGSSRKETYYFSETPKEGNNHDREKYTRYFTNCKDAVPVVMEASPCYLGDAETALPRMRSLVPDAKLLFILRDPVDRLYSMYNFHVGNLNIPAEIGFQEYAEMCLAYENGEIDPANSSVDEWYLKAAESGQYARKLASYFDAYPHDSIKVTYFDDLRKDAKGYMLALSEFLGIDESYWQGYRFHVNNMTSIAKNKLFHKAAVYVDSKTELILRHRPRLKRSITSLYKRLNQASEGYESMPNSVRKTLTEYYRPHNLALHKMLGDDTPRKWSAYQPPQDA